MYGIIMASCLSILLLEMIQRHCHEPAQSSDKKNNKKDFHVDFNQKNKKLKVKGSFEWQDQPCGV